MLHFFLKKMGFVIFASFAKTGVSSASKNISLYLGYVEKVE